VVVAQQPPTLLPASNIATAKPLRVSKFAAANPATPAPITTTGLRLKENSMV
jgi:hypothetical protein